MCADSEWSGVQVCSFSTALGKEIRTLRLWCQYAAYRFLLLHVNGVILHSTVKGETEDTMKHVSKKMKMIRCERGLTSAEAAKACGLHRSVYSRIETGSKIPKIDEITAVASGLSTTVRQLLGEDLKLPAGIQEIVDILERLPEASRVRMLELLQAGALAPEDSTLAVVTLLQRQRNQGS